MRHKIYKEWLRLSLYDELGKEQTRLLEQHIFACALCRSERESLKKVQTAFAGGPGAASPELLEEARNELQTSIAFIRQSERLMRKPGWSEWLQSSRLGLATGTLALLITGFMLGYGAFRYTSRPTETNHSAAIPETANPDSGRIRNIRLATPINVQTTEIASADQDVEFTYELITQSRSKGRLSDPHIQKMLALALINERNAGVRLQSVAAIHASNRMPADPAVQQALIDAMIHDENPGVRLQALDTLKRYPQNDSVKRAFMAVLTSDKLPGLRIQAINALTDIAPGSNSIDPEIVKIFRDRFVNDENSYIRLQARKFVQENSL